VAATPDRAVNRRVFDEAERRGVFCNVADDPELCSLILPAVHRVDPIAVAVSTGGASPALAQRLRDDIAKVVGPEHASLARELRRLRPWAQAQLATYDERKEYFAQLVARALP
jgi:precorrin-2 dehydrogenase